MNRVVFKIYIIIYYLYYIILCILWNPCGRWRHFVSGCLRRRTIVSPGCCDWIDQFRSVCPTGMRPPPRQRSFNEITAYNYIYYIKCQKKINSLLACHVNPCIGIHNIVLHVKILNRTFTKTINVIYFCVFFNILFFTYLFNF